MLAALYKESATWLTHHLGLRRGVPRFGPELEPDPAAEQHQRAGTDDKRHDLTRCVRCCGRTMDFLRLHQPCDCGVQRPMAAPVMTSVLGLVARSACSASFNVGTLYTDLGTFDRNMHRCLPLLMPQRVTRDEIVASIDRQCSIPQQRVERLAVARKSQVVDPALVGDRQPSSMTAATRVPRPSPSRYLDSSASSRGLVRLVRRPRRGKLLVLFAALAK